MMKRFIYIPLIILAACIAVSAAEAKPKIKYALAILHYNLQYVAGDEKIENRIIEGSFAPMIDFFLAHPDWGADFEMQGYMVEQTAKRYPEIFAKFKTLLDRGQVELVSFHYSDQLFLAYPRRDMEWSRKLNDDTLNSLGAKRSGVVFTQEGQFGEGMADFMKDNGYTILSLPKNLLEFLHGNKPVAPYYEMRGVKVIVAGRGLQYSGENADVDVEWTYMNDAELLPTGGATPYYAKFKPKSEAIAEYENRLKDLEARGFKIGNITQYVADLEKAGVPAQKLPPMLDGDWQPADTMNIFRWMGDHHAQYERDNDVLTANVRARHKLLAAEIVIEYLKKQEKSTSEIEIIFAAALHDLMLAEVSDSTGWTPTSGEVKYSLGYAKQSEKLSGEIFSAAKKTLSTHVIKINTMEETVQNISEGPRPFSGNLTKSGCPVKITISGELSSENIQCFKQTNNVWNAEVVFKTILWHKKNFALKFARETDTITYSPALLDGETVSYNLSEFTPEKDWLYLPSPNGLIGLGNGLFLIKDTSTVHIAYHFPISEKVVSLEMLKPPNGTYKWKFKIVKGTVQEALDIADSLNIHPTIEH